MGRLRTDLANWFDNGMDRLSGDFNRRTQLMTFVIALVAAFVVNLDTIRVGTVLWDGPALAEKLKATSLPSSDPKTDADAIKDEEQVLAAITKIAQEGFPVGWAPGHFLDIQDDQGNWEALWVAPPSIWYRPLLGWFITAVAALFGAPFWFDTLPVDRSPQGRRPEPGRETEQQGRGQLGEYSRISGQRRPLCSGARRLDPFTDAFLPPIGSGWIMSSG